MARLKVTGYESLVRDTRSNGIINNNQTEYSLYMARVRAREKREQIVLAGVGMDGAAPSAPTFARFAKGVSAAIMV